MTNDDGEHDLFSACKNGDIVSVKRIVDDCGGFDSNILVPACQNGHIELVKYLVEKGADTSVCDDEVIADTFISGYTELARYLVDLNNKRLREGENDENNDSPCVFNLKCVCTYVILFLFSIALLPAENLFYEP